MGPRKLNGAHLSFDWRTNLVAAQSEVITPVAEASRRGEDNSARANKNYFVFYALGQLQLVQDLVAGFRWIFRQTLDLENGSADMQMLMQKCNSDIISSLLTTLYSNFFSI